MRLIRVTGSSLAALALSLALPVFAQTVGSDMKDAGHDTAHATKTVGHDTAHGTKKVYHKSVRGTKTAGRDTKYGTEVGAKKTATGTRNVGRRIEGKPTVPNHPEDTTPKP